MFIVKFIIGIIIHLITNLISLKFKILLDDPKYLEHKKMINKKTDVVLSGGSVFVLLFLIFTNINYDLKLFILFIFFIGLISDLKILDVPSLRFFLQFLIVAIFTYLLNLSVSFTNLKYLDLILEFKFLSIFFTIICFLVLINGSNFLDGLNSLVIFYYILVLLSFVLLVNNYNLDYDLSLIFNIILILFVLAVFNLLNKSFLGDSGAYSVAGIIGYIAIDFFQTIGNFSVLFIVTVLWYPAFETLFSVIRKFILKSNPINPDNQHFHHCLFNFINSKIKKSYNANLFTAVLINLYNLFVFFLATLSYKSSILLSTILFVNIIVYIALYLRLNNER